MDWLVDGLIPKNHIVLLLGQPQNGKSWASAELAVCVASGTKFLDEFNVCQGDPTILDEDTPTDVFESRLTRLAKGVGKTLDELSIEKHSLDGFMLWNDDQRASLIERIKAKKNPLVVLDSLEKVMVGYDLNKTSNAVKATKYWNELKAAGATVIIIHHISLKKQIDIREWDLSGLAMGNTMLVAGSDTILFIFRVPINSSTRFIVKPQERRTKLVVNRPFAIELREGDGSWAKLVLLEEPTIIPSENARYVIPLFAQYSKGLTVKGAIDQLKGGLADNEVREALRELEKEKVLIRGREAHNRYIYSLNLDFDNNQAPTTEYWDAIKEYLV